MDGKPVRVRAHRPDHLRARRSRGSPRQDGIPELRQGVSPAWPAGAAGGGLATRRGDPRARRPRGRRADPRGRRALVRRAAGRAADLAVRAAAGGRRSCPSGWRPSSCPAEARTPSSEGEPQGDRAAAVAGSWTSRLRAPRRPRPPAPPPPLPAPPAPPARRAAPPPTAPPPATPQAAAPRRRRGPPRSRPRSARPRGADASRADGPAPAARGPATPAAGRRTPAAAAPAAGATAAPPPVEVITAPPPAAPPENGVSAIRDVTLEPGVPDLTRGRRPVRAAPRAHGAAAPAPSRCAFSVSAAGTTSVQGATGPDLLSRRRSRPWRRGSFRRTRAERVYLVAVFTYAGTRHGRRAAPGAPPAAPRAPPRAARRAGLAGTASARTVGATGRLAGGSAPASLLGLLLGRGLLRRGLLLLGLGLGFLLVRGLLRGLLVLPRLVLVAERARGWPSPPRRPCGGRGAGCGCSRRAGSRSARRGCRRASSPPSGPGCRARRGGGRGGGSSSRLARVMSFSAKGRSSLALIRVVRMRSLLEEGGGEVAEQGDPVGRGAPQLAVGDAVSHGLFLTPLTSGSAASCRASCRARAPWWRGSP